MNVQLDMFNVQMQEGQNCILKDIRKKDDITEYDLVFSWTKDNVASNDGFTVSWKTPIKNFMYKWDATCKLHRNIDPHWYDAFDSMISVNAPLSCLFDGNDVNSYCWALSECCKLVNIKNGYEDNICCLAPQFSFKIRQYTNQYETKITLRIDERRIPMRKVVEDVALWWEKDVGITPTHAPYDAGEPLYSFWYSHHQDVNEENVEEQCRLAKDLGFEICIVDDGWHTDGNEGSYVYCGDWKPAFNKFPDMAAHIKRVHEIGMKYILWYSVPMIGYKSVNYARFKDMMLREDQGFQAIILDPRYKEVREFLVGVFKKALIDWDLDGFKLDFVDTWNNHDDNAPYNEKMDIPALQDAVNVCMNEIAHELMKIKPDVLLEFRQAYIGPHMKQFGNMFRVSDCAGDFIRNRASILDMRMMMGDLAVHSDMLMLPPSEDCRINALQIISCMFGVMQFSGRLERLTPAAIEMSRFWLSFFKEHRALLQSKNLEAYESHLLYTWAKTTEQNECAVGVYAIDKCIKPDPVDTIYIANGCMGERLIIELEGTYKVQVLDCCGHSVECFTKAFSGITCLPVPIGAMVILKK